MKNILRRLEAFSTEMLERSTVAERHANELAVAMAAQVVRQRAYDAAAHDLVAGLASRVNHLSKGVLDKSPTEQKSEPQRLQGHPPECVRTSDSSDDLDHQTFQRNRTARAELPCPLGCTAEMQTSITAPPEAKVAVYTFASAPSSRWLPTLRQVQARAVAEGLGRDLHPRVSSRHGDRRHKRGEPGRARQSSRGDASQSHQQSRSVRHRFLQTVARHIWRLRAAALRTLSIISNRQSDLGCSRSRRYGTRRSQRPYGSRHRNISERQLLEPAKIQLDQFFIDVSHVGQHERQSAPSPRPCWTAEDGAAALSTSWRLAQRLRSCPPDAADRRAAGLGASETSGTLAARRCRSVENGGAFSTHVRDRPGVHFSGQVRRCHRSPEICTFDARSRIRVRCCPTAWPRARYSYMLELNDVEANLQLGLHHSFLLSVRRNTYFVFPPRGAATERTP